MISYQTWEKEVPENILSDIRQLYQLIFETTDFQKFQNRVKKEKDLLFITAYKENTLLGFKIGYQKTPHVFYSWLGGINPDFRNQGIATALMLFQHEWAKKNNYEIIETKTMNRWKNMLILNLKHGFDIHSTYSDSNGIIKIILQKQIK